MISEIESICLGGVGFRLFNFENTISTYGLGMMAWTCTNNFRVVLGPSEASEQKNGSKTGNLKEGDRVKLFTPFDLS